MAQFNIGDRVVKIDNDTHGTVIGVRSGRGRVIYTVMFSSGEMAVLEPDLRLDCNLSDPFERCKSGIFGSYSDFAKKNTALILRPVALIVFLTVSLKPCSFKLYTTL